MQIFDFDDYREFLLHKFKEMQSQHKYFSFQYAANKLNKSKTFLKYILDKKRHISLDQVPSIAKLFQLDDKEANYLTIMVIQNTSNQPDVSEYFTDVLKRMKSGIISREALNIQSNEHQHSNPIFNSWLTMTVASMAKLRGFEPNVQWIQKQLKDQINAEQLQNVLDDLIANQTIICEDGTWKRSQYILQFPHDFDLYGVSLNAVATKKMTEVLMQPLQYKPFSSYMMTVGIRKEDSNLVIQKMEQLRDDLICMSRNCEESETVMFVSNNAFTFADLNS